jgi:hypothetical protein
MAPRRCRLLKRSVHVWLGFSAYGNQTVNLTVRRFARQRVRRIDFRAGTIDRRAVHRKRHSFPRALLVSGGQLYVADAPSKRSKHPNGSISVYPLGLIYPYQTITEGIHTPDALAVDGSGNLYVANLNGHNVTVYAPGGNVPIRTITDGVSSPRALGDRSAGEFVRRQRVPKHHFGLQTLNGEPVADDQRRTQRPDCACAKRALARFDARALRYHARCDFGSTPGYVEDR